MKNRTIPTLLILFFFITSIACNLLTSAAKPSSSEELPLPTLEEIAPTAASQESQQAETAAPEETSVNSPFPLPDDAAQVMEVGEKMVNFQTKLSLQEVVDFYRAAFESQGLQERDALTTINDQAISLVFDGSPNGKAIVVQGFPLGDGKTNVSIRYEDV